MTIKLKFEVGKFYKTVKGKKVRLFIICNGGLYFVCNEGNYFTNFKGIFLDNIRQPSCFSHDYDIIDYWR